MVEAWVERELATLDLGDKRRNRRCMATVQAFWNTPDASIPEASRSPAELQGIYGLLSAETTDPEAIRQAHADAVVERIRGCEEVWVLHDTSELAFNTLRATEGLGPLSGSYSRGLLMHSAMVVDPARVPQGLLHQEIWARDEREVGKRHTRRQRRIEEKESERWLKTVRVCEERLPASMRAWIVGDSESDIYEYMAVPRRAGIDLLIRATHNRRVDGSEAAARYLWEAAEAAEEVGQIEVQLKRTREREARRAKLSLRLCESLEIVRPQRLKKQCAAATVTVSVVLVREIGTVPEGEEPVEWLLVSTRPLKGFEAAVTCVQAYAERWKVERYHYTLKSGCQVEKLQLERADRIERAVALYSIVAWRQLHITYLARMAPDLPCTTALDADEWKVLHRMANPGRRLPRKPMSLKEAVRQIARLGGFLGRKADGEPGVKVIWRGLRRLADFVLAFRTLTPRSRLVTNG
jgi:transposase Tn5 family protein/transposase-like protein